MKKIMLATRNQSDMTSFLRAWGIFTHSTMKPHVQIVPPPKDFEWIFQWNYFWDVDCILLHRPGSAPAVDMRIINMAKNHGIPVWVDMDDDLESITADNPSFPDYNSDAVRQTIKYAIEQADVLTCGGERHRDRLINQYERDVILLPNAIDDRLLHLKRPFTMNQRIAWRGSESHRIDLHYFEKEFGMLMGDRNTTFFGLNPYQFEWVCPEKKYQWLSKQNLMDYYHALTTYNASIHLMPLLDTEFNRVKSNLCWSDATLAGSVLLGPTNFEEYNRPGVWGYIGGDRDSFFEQGHRMLGASESELRQMHDLSWEWIRDNILVSKVNLKRLEILKNL